MRMCELKPGLVDKVTGKPIKDKKNMIILRLGTTIKWCYVKHSDDSIRLQNEDGIFEYTPDNLEKYLRKCIAMYGERLNLQELWTWASNGKAQPPSLRIVS